MILDSIEKLYREIDGRVCAIACFHRGRLNCRRGCRSCCIDSLTVFEVEAENIRGRCLDLLKNETPHPRGACAFLDTAGACRIYEHRPYVCRTQGLPLRWLAEKDEDADDAEIVEMRDICPLNEPGEPIERLPENACWTIGPVESRLSEIQKEFGAGEMRRVEIRSLFRKKPLCRPPRLSFK